MKNTFHSYNGLRNMLTAVIPTRNRPDDLPKAVASVCAQTRLPDELIIVDQSSGNASREHVSSVMVGIDSIKLVYIHDTSILGLVDAKRVASEWAGGDIVCFLEDDVVLESDYFEQIELGFVSHPAMIGCCGIISNAPKQVAGYTIFFKLFHRGIFFDRRVGLHGSFSGRGNELVASEMLSGGSSAWRREVFSAVSFDVENGLHMSEDVDFSTRVARRFPGQLFINPNARLAHYCSPVNRETLGPRQRRKLTECIIYYKKRREWSGSTVALPWLLFGMFLEGLLESYSVRSLDPVLGYFLGLFDGFKKKIVSQAD